MKITIEELLNQANRNYSDCGRDGNYLADFQDNGPKGSGPFLVFYYGAPAFVGAGLVLKNKIPDRDYDYAIVGEVDTIKIRRRIEDSLRKLNDIDLLLRIGSMLNVKLT